ncbi:MAG: hypothetical protein ABIA04_10290 [Pseudomonadota bacterium]
MSKKLAWQEIKVKVQKIKGIVVPCKWDSDNLVIQASIVTDLEEEYYITNSDSANNLINQLNNMIEVTGNIETIKKGKKYNIKIISYRRIKKFI